MTRPQWFQDWLDKEFKPVHDWWLQWTAGWKWFLGITAVFSAIGTLFGLLALYGFRP